MRAIGSTLFRTVLGTLLGVVLLVPVELAMQPVLDRLLPNMERVNPSTTGSPDDPVLSYLGVADPIAEQTIGGGAVQFNERGMRGPPILTPKPARTRRILALGSQETLGASLSANEVYGQVAVDALGGARVGLEFVNAARPDFSAVQSLNLMEMRGWAVEPDLVVVGDNAANWSLGTFPDDDLLVPMLGPQLSAPVLSGSALYRAIYMTIGRWRDGRAVRRQQSGGGLDLVRAEGQVRVGTNAYAHVLETLQSRASDHRAELVFVIFPVPGDIAYGHVPRVIGQYRTVMQDTARRHGILVVDGARALADEERPSSELFGDDGQLRPLGHRLLGKALARALRGWTRGGRVGTTGEGGSVPTYTEPKLEDL